MNRNNFNGQNSVATSAVNVVVNDIRNNGGNYKWQIEKVNVIKEFFNDDFFADDLGQYIEVEIVVNSREVFPKVYFNGEYYFPEVSAFQSSKKSVSDMVASMTEMIKNIAVECGFIESDFYPLSFVSFVQQEQVAEQDEDEQDEDDAAIEYLREVMPVIPVDIISEKIDECVVDLCLVENDKSTFWDEVILGLISLVCMAVGALLVVLKPSLGIIDSNIVVVTGAMIGFLGFMFLPCLIYRLLTNDKASD